MKNFEKRRKFLTIVESSLSADHLQKINELNSPVLIQKYLDDMPYVAEERDRSPLNVILDQQCHCLDGGLFASFALWRIGFSPLLIDLVPEAGTDDDHVLAIFRINNLWGAVAKSNYVNLGFRDPVYKTLRELVMTYFEHYCNTYRQKTLRGFTRPVNLENYLYLNWATNEIDANKFYYSHFYGRKTIPLLHHEDPQNINLVSERAYKAETLYTDLNWTFGNRENH